MASKTKRKASARPERDLPTRDEVLLTRPEVAELSSGAGTRAEVVFPG